MEVLPESSEAVIVNGLAPRFSQSKKEFEAENEVIEQLSLELTIGRLTSSVYSPSAFIEALIS